MESKNDTEKMDTSEPNAEEVRSPEKKSEKAASTPVEARSPADSKASRAGSDHDDDDAKSAGSEDDSNVREMTEDEKRLMKEPIDHELDVDDLSSPKPSKPVKRRRGGKSAVVGIDPRWLEPFEIGWRRELVHRGTASGEVLERDFNSPADVYYFSPEGKKLRSLVQIEANLQENGSPLETENFTFRKILVHTEPYEIRRWAGGRGGRGGTPRGGSSRGGSPRGRGGMPKIMLKTSPVAGGRGMGSKRGRARKIDITPARKENLKAKSKAFVDTDSDSDSSGAPAAKRSKHILEPVNTSPAHSPKTYIELTPVSSQNKPGEKRIDLLPKTHGSQGTSGSPPKKKSFVAKKHTAPRPDVIKKKSSSNEKKTEPNLNGNTTTPKKFDMGPRLCGLVCPGLVNIPPSLHCATCMMLFHPECVKFVRDPNNPNKTFNCASCNLSGVAGAIAPVPPPPAPVSVTPTLATPPLKPLTNKNLTPTPTMVTTPRSTLMASSRVSPVTARPQVPKPAAPVMAPKNPNISSVDLTKIISSNQVTGQLLTLPPSVLNHLDLKQPLALRVDDKVLMIPPNCFISSGTAMKVFLPPGTLPKNLFQEPSQPVNFNFQSKHDQQVLNFSIGSPVKKNNKNGDSEKNSAGKENDEADKTAKLSKKQAKSMAPEECFFQKLHTGYDCMIKIFRYLKMTDLLQASLVCQTWKKVARQDCLWRVVRLRDSRVACWEKAAETFKEHNTFCLDLRGMLFFEDRNRTWHQFTAVLKKLDTIRRIHFCHSPAMMLTGVTDNVTQLEVLTAEFITDVLPESQMWSTNTRLDVGKFSNLKELQVLKLRGVCGIALPAFSFKGGPPALESLTGLKTLVLTTLRNTTAAEFTFLPALKNLETLEIGDCDGWDASTYENLKQLTNLKSLRLESGGSSPEPALGDALLQLKSLENLELIKFAVHSNIVGTLKELTKLETLSIWPDTASSKTAEINTNTLNAVKPLTFIKSFDWGVMSSTTQEEPSSEGAETKESCISFIDEDADPESGDGKPKEKLVSINKIVSVLCAELPNTSIKVYKLPVIESNTMTENTEPQP